MTQPRVRIVSLNPDLEHDEDKSPWGLFYELERAWGHAALAQGLEYVVFGALGARPAAKFPFRVIPTFLVGSSLAYNPTRLFEDWRDSRDFCDRVLWSFERLRQTSGGDTFHHVFMFYHGHPGHLAALIRVGLALGGSSPIIVNLHYLHYMVGPNHPLTCRSQLRAFLTATKGLRHAANLHLRVDSPQLAEIFERETGEPIEVLPFFSPMGDDIDVQSATRAPGAPIRLVYPTAVPSEGKGFGLVVGLAERLGRSDVEILTREPGEWTWDVCLPTVAALRGGFRSLESFLPGSSYQELLRGADVVLVPYRRWQFLSRTSGVVADAIKLDKPLVGIDGTWIGDQIAQAGAGHTFPDGDIDGFVEAVRRAIDEIGVARSHDSERRERWLQQNNLGAFWRSVLSAGVTRTRRLGVITIFSLMHLAYVTRISMPIRAAAGERLNALVRRWRGLRGGASGSLLLVRDAEVRKRGRPTIFERLSAIRWKTRGVETVELRLDRPDGLLIIRGGPQGEVSGTTWIHDGRLVFLQDVSNGRPLHSDHTLDCVRFCYRNDPDPVSKPATDLRITMALLPLVRTLRWIRGLGTGRLRVTTHSVESTSPVTASVSWSCRVDAQVEIRVEAPDGTLFVKTVGPGSNETGPWVVAGVAFFLVDARPGIPTFLKQMDVYRVPDPPRYPVTGLSRAWRTLRWVLGRTTGSVHELPRRARVLSVALPVLKGLRRVFGLATGRLSVTVRERPFTASIAWACHAVTPIEIYTGETGDLVARGGTAEGTVDLGAWAASGATLLLHDGARPQRPSVLRVLDIATILPVPQPTQPRVENVPSQVPVKPSLSSAVGPSEWGIVPPLSSGELYLVIRYSSAILERLGGSRIVAFGRRGQISLGRLFEDAPVTVLDRDEFDLEVLRQGVNHGRVFELNYGHYRDHVFGRYHGLYAGFSRLLLDELGVSLNARTFEPRVPADVLDAARQRFRALKLVEGRTAILAPLSYSWQPNAWDSWCRIAEGLTTRGFRVVTNCGPEEVPIPRTLPWRGNLAELYATAEVGGFVLTARSGIADVCSTAKTRLHILQRDSAFSGFPSIIIQTSLADNGLPDRAAYHTQQLDEEPFAFADRVLGHPDFA